MTKVCNRCHQEQLLTAFVKRSGTKDGYCAQCKVCYNTRNRARYADDADFRVSLAVNNTRYKGNNEDKVVASNRRYREENPETVKASKRRWVEQNRGKHNAKAARYRAAKFKATPQWLTAEHLCALQIVYETCPKGWHVDHIEPLQGKNVCGLHVPWNLQHLPAVENRRKGNKH